MRSQFKFDPSRGAAGGPPGEREQSLQRIRGGSPGGILGARVRGAWGQAHCRGCVRSAGLWHFGEGYLPDATHLGAASRGHLWEHQQRREYHVGDRTHRAVQRSQLAALPGGGP